MTIDVTKSCARTGVSRPFFSRKRYTKVVYIPLMSRMYRNGIEAERSRQKSENLAVHDTLRILVAIPVIRYVDNWLPTTNNRPCECLLDYFANSFFFFVILSKRFINWCLYRYVIEEDIWTIDTYLFIYFILSDSWREVEKRNSG